jgi:hypothetical protein
MTAVQRWGAAVVLAVVAGTLAGWLVGVGPAAGPVTPRASDRVDEAVAALRDDPFYVAPEMRHLLDGDQREAISQALRRSDEPVHLIYLHETSEGGYYLEAYLLDRLAERLGPGFYAAVNEKMSPTPRDYEMRFDYPDGRVLKARPADGLLAYAEELAGLEVRDDSPHESDYWGGPGGGFAAGALMAVGISLVIGAVLGFGGFLRRSASPGRKQR